jgi:predicted dehydrogenase
MNTSSDEWNATDDLRDTYGHSPVSKMFEVQDVYGIGFEPRRAERRPLRFGVIGAGGVSQSKWLPALARLQTMWDPVDLVGIADPDEVQGRKVERLHGGRWFRDHVEMLERAKPEAVLVASPDALHFQHTRDALERGIAALVEKPFCVSLVDADELCKLAAGRQITLMAVANLRFSPPFRRAHQLMSSLGAFVAPGLLLGRMQLGYDYVDLLEDTTVHLYDLARFLMGDVDRVEAAHGVGRQEGRHTYPFRQAVITMKFSSGSLGQFATSSSALSLKPWLRVEVHGDGSWLVVDDVFELTLYDNETGPTKSWRPVLTNTLLFDEEFGGYMNQLEHFLQVVRGEEAALIDGADGYRALEMVFATHLAIAGGAPVQLPIDPGRSDKEVAAALGRL